MTVGRIVQRVWGGAAAARLALAAVPLALWAVPATHARPSVTADWRDAGDAVQLHLVRRGWDRHGFVRQTRDRTWYAPHAAALDDVRRLRGTDLTGDLVHSQSQWLQHTWYGNDHVYGPGGRGFVEAGQTDTVPYSLMAIGLASPAMAWGAVAVRRRRRRRADRKVAVDAVH